ncbi:MAG: tripartite tricarboxylate transporter substrate binding protein [Pigmentiphaga sp.]|nr:tripartite tricarboxylate transporter substrate binding protein [Pigmentiphaga sp.]
MQRRDFLTTLGAGAALAALPGRAALANGFPNRAIQIVGGFGPGSSSDIVTRLVSPGMHERLGQPIVTHNVQGAAGHIATLQVAKANPDGYTLLMATNSQLSANPHLLPPQGFDPNQAFEPVVPVCYIGLVIVTPADSPIDSLEAAMKASRDGRMLTYGTPGVATPMHLVGEMLSEQAGGKLMHVPYKGGAQMLTDLVSGQIDLGIVAYTPAAGFVGDGRLRALAVCGDRRLQALPDVPAIPEVVPGISMGAWCALMAPAGTPADVRSRIADAFSAAAAAPDIQAQLIEIGNDPITGGEAEVRGLMASEYALAGGLIRRLNIQLG